MQPVVNPLRPRSTLALGNLVGMVDGHVVNTASVNVKMLAKVLHAHCRTFNMPARVASSPWGIPSQSLVLKLALCKPKHKVVGAALVWVNLYAGTCLKVVYVNSGKLTVVRVSRNVIVKVSTSHVGVAVGFNALYKLNHLRNVLGSLANNVRAADIQRVNVRKKGIRIEFCNFQN